MIANQATKLAATLGPSLSTGTTPSTSSTPTATLPAALSTALSAGTSGLTSLVTGTTTGTKSGLGGLLQNVPQAGPGNSNLGNLKLGNPLETAKAVGDFIGKVIENSKETKEQHDARVAAEEKKVAEALAEKKAAQEKEAKEAAENQKLRAENRGLGQDVAFLEKKYTRDHTGIAGKQNDGKEVDPAREGFDPSTKFYTPPS